MHIRSVCCVFSRCALTLSVRLLSRVVRERERRRAESLLHTHDTQRDPETESERESGLVIDVVCNAVRHLTVDSISTYIFFCNVQCRSNGL